MLGAFAVPRRPAWMIGLAAHRLRNLHARRRRRPSACRIAEPCHDRAEGTESNGNSKPNQPTAMLRVSGAGGLGGVGVRFTHRWHMQGCGSAPGIRADVSSSNSRSTQNRNRALGTSTERNARAKSDVAKWHTQTGAERTSALKHEQAAASRDPAAARARPRRAQPRTANPPSPPSARRAVGPVERRRRRRARPRSPRA